jgi:xanthosine utilization system XapX-like protein
MTPVMTERQEMEGHLEIRFDGEVIKDVSVAVLQVFNSGNEALNPDDFLEPLRLGIQGEGRVLLAEVTETVPKELTQPITLDNNAVEFARKLMNAGDLVTVRLIVTQLHGTLELDGRVSGVTRFQRVLAPGPEVGFFDFLLFILGVADGAGAGLVLAALIATLFDLDRPWPQVLALVGLFGGGAIAVLVVSRIGAGPQRHSSEFRRAREESAKRRSKPPFS